ncbi:MAG: cupin domain-containing protein [Blastocatellia bacterium]|nr:cupin domain-containing protein [Blastocatellia bacterium]
MLGEEKHESSDEKAHLRLADALSHLTDPEGLRSATLFEHGSLEVKIYAPRGSDRQKPHDRDEIYVVAQGSGVFFDGATRRRFRAGDLIFAPAGSEHRFEEFTEDFAVWVMFYGPEGGEAGGI